MKKMRLFGLFMAMIMGVSFTACEEEEANIYINIDTSTPIPTEDVTVGTNLSFDFTVTSDNNIEEILIREGSTVFKTITKDDLTGKKSHNGEFNFLAETIKTLYFAIEVEDSKGKIEIRSFEVNVVAAPGEINTYTAVLLGNQNNATTGSFYASTNNQVYLNQAAFQNQELIDFVYYYGASNNATIAAPDDADAATIFDGPTYGLSKWTTKRNSTKFKVSLKSQAEFEDIENDALIVAESNLNNSSAKQLEKGFVVAFETEADKKGLILVKNIDLVGNTITIEVKVQK